MVGEGKYDGILDEFQPSNPEFIESSNSYYHRLRNISPMIFRPDHGDWLVTGYFEVKALLEHPGIRSGEHSILDSSGGNEQNSSEYMLIRTSGERHRQLRSLFARWFSKSVLRRYRVAIENVAHRLLERLPPDTPVDLVHHYINPFALEVVGELLGIPEQDWPKIRMLVEQFNLSHDISNQGSQDALFRRKMVLRNLESYAVSSLNDIGERSTKSLMSELLKSCRADQSQLDESAIIANYVLLIIAGFDNTQNALAQVFYQLLRFAEVKQIYMSNSERIGEIIDETLRYTSPLQLETHTASTDFEISGHTIVSGQKLHLVIAAANRDPFVFDEPDKFCLRRTQNNHLSFGSGNHYCVGSHLAKLEVEIAVDVLFSKFPSICLYSEPKRLDHFNVNGISGLLVKLN